MKKRGSRQLKFCATVFSITLVFQSVFAQAQMPEVTVTVFRDLVRFAVPGEVQEMRVEVFSAIGEKIFDSNLVAGHIQDWPLQNLQGKAVDSGLYAYTVTVKDQAGVLKQMQRGNLLVDRGREGMEIAPPINQSDARSSGNTQPQPTGSWDVDHGKNPYVINTPMMGIGTQNPRVRLHVGAGTAEPITQGSTLLLEEGEAAAMVLKSTTGGEMFFSQDKNHGLFGTASNHPFGIRTNNQNRLWITGEGNVGIGTITPGSPLTVAGGIEMTSGGLKFPDGTIQTTAANATSDNSPSNPGNIPKAADQNSAANHNNAFGQKGKRDKTVSPELFVNEDLTINGNIIFTPPSPQFVRDITMQNNNGGLRFFGAPSLTNSPAAAAIQFWGNSSPFPGQLYLDSGAHDNGAVIIRTAGTGGTIAERMRVTAAGNVGIGTTSPQATLDIAAGRMHIGGQCGGAVPNTQGAYISWNQLPPPGQPCGFGETDFINHQGSGPGGFAFINTGNGIPPLSTLMYISGGGNVGIGTTTPDSKLTVTGDIHLTSGGLKFADGTSQTTRGLSSITTNASMLDGNGTSGSPLAIHTPLDLVSSVSSQTFSGTNTSTFPSGVGVYGQANGGIGARGFHTAATGTAPGVRGETNSSDANAVGVLGVVNPTGAGAFSAAVRGINNGTAGLGIGVYGSQAGSGWGVYGTTPNGRGVFGESNSGVGVYGTSASGEAGHFDGKVTVNGDPGILVASPRALAHLHKLGESTNDNFAEETFPAADLILEQDGSRGKSWRIGSGARGTLFVTTADQSGDNEKNLLYVSRNLFNVRVDTRVDGNVQVLSDVFPTGNNISKLGTSGHAWADVVTFKVTNLSDARLKQDVTGLAYGLAEVMRLRPVTYKWKGGTDDRVYLGLIAQEAEKVIPEIIERGTDPSAMLGLRYTEIIPVLIKAVQEQQTAIDHKDARIMELEAKSAVELKQINMLREQNAALDARLTVIERAKQPRSASVRTFKSRRSDLGQSLHSVRNPGFTKK
jgi:Chaperone of endosialidase